MRILLLCLAVLVLLASSISPVQACPAVERTTLTIANWIVDEFQDPVTGVPIQVELEFVDVVSGTIVQYHDGSSWLPVTEDLTTEGQAVRFQSGSATVVYRGDGECEEEIVYASAS